MVSIKLIINVENYDKLNSMRFVFFAQDRQVGLSWVFLFFNSYKTSFSLQLVDSFTFVKGVTAIITHKKLLNSQPTALCYVNKEISFIDRNKTDSE